MTGVNVPQLLAVAAMVTAMIAAITAIGRSSYWLWLILRSLSRLADDLMGEPARGQQPARPGVLDRLVSLEQLVAHRMDAVDERVHALDHRLAAVEGQLRPNGGGSLRDAVDRLAPATTTRQET